MVYNFGDAQNSVAQWLDLYNFVNQKSQQS